MKPISKTISAGVFKAQCLAIMDEVHAKREAVTITKRGKPVARLIPVDEQSDDIFNFMAGKGKAVGDIVLPALSEDEWGNLQ